MGDRWYVGLSGGREVWIHADEARVDEGYLILSRQGEDGPSVALAAAPGEWTTLTREPTRPAADFTPEVVAFCSGLDLTSPQASPSAARIRPFAERRRIADRRRARHLPGPGIAWNGVERRSGLDRRAS